MTFRFEAEVFAWEDPASPGGSWRFARLPVDVADELRDRAASSGWGSIRVTVSIGETTWQTSVFPDKATGSFLLPVKRAVRDAEGIDDGDVVTVNLEPAA
jgi:hypothetical protein